MSKPIYAYSTNEEEFYGEYSTKEEAIEEAFFDNEPDDTIWVGEIVHATEFLTEKMVERAVDNLIENIDEELGECIASDDWIISMTSEHTMMLAEDIHQFLVSHARFHRRGLKSVTKHKRRETSE
jgi:hypothetical protein